MKKRLTYHLCDNREGAEAFCKKHGIRNATVLPHTLKDGWSGFIVWYKG